MNADASRIRREQSEQDSYFVPLSDLLGGLIFIFLIMMSVYGLLQAGGLYSNADDEIARKQRAYMEVVRSLYAERDQLLRTIGEDLARAGVKNTVDIARGRIVMASSSFFETAGMKLSSGGIASARKIAAILDARLHCPGETIAPCVNSAVRPYFEAARLGVADAPGSGERSAELVRTLSLLTEVFADRTGLTELKNTAGTPFMRSYRGKMDQVPDQPQKSQTGVVLDFMLAPPKPPAENVLPLEPSLN